MSTAYTDNMPLDDADLPSGESTEEVGYRAISPPAVVAGVLAMLSPLTFFDAFWAVLPAAGMFMALRAWWFIRREPNAWTGLPLAIGGGLVSLACFVGGLSWLAHVAANKVPPGFLPISFEKLQPDTAVLGQYIPPEAVRLNGQSVYLEGYMYPSDRMTGIREFVLVRDKGECCFGGNPKLTDRVLVKLDDSNPINFSTSLTSVVGTFQVDPDRREVVYYKLTGAHTP